VKETQVLDTLRTNVTSGTFTLAFGDPIWPLPGTVDATHMSRFLETSTDLTSFISRGDAISIGGNIYTVDLYQDFNSTHLPLNTAFTGLSNGTAVAYSAATTANIPYDATASQLEYALEMLPNIGKLGVVRSPENHTGYTWTVTFETDVGDQPTVVVNPLNLLGAYPDVIVSTTEDGVEPDNYMSIEVVPGGATKNQVLFEMLTMGTPYYVRVSAASDRGYGWYGTPLLDPVAPTQAPGTVSSVVLSRDTATSLLVTYTQDADPGGLDVTGYTVEWDISSTFSNIPQVQNMSLDPTIQVITVSAFTLPFTATSVFTLSPAVYQGDFTSRVGGINRFGQHTFVDLQAGKYVINKSNLVNGMGDASFSGSIARGEFLRIMGQEFRVCLSTDASFLASYNMSYDRNHIPLCSKDDPWTAAAYDGGPRADSLVQVPVYRLSTALGAGYDLGIGDTSVQTLWEDGSVNNLTSILRRGDYVRIGHPTEGERFRVHTTNTFTDSLLPLGSVVDPSMAVSVTSVSLRHSTCEVQAISIYSPTGNLTAGALAPSGYRLYFNGQTTATTTAGGGSGCLLWDGSAASVEAELESLANIDDVTVSRRVMNRHLGDIGDGVQYLVTFVGDLVRGNVPRLSVVNLGSFGCSDAGATNASHIFANRARSSVTTVTRSYVPIYTTEKTADIPVAATADDVKYALEALNSVAKVDVVRTVNLNGYSWTVTFTEPSNTSSDSVPIAPLLANGLRLSAVVDPGITVTSLTKLKISTSRSGTPYFVRVAGRNANGLGAWKSSTPVALQPAPRVPGAPKLATVKPLSLSELIVEWDEPLLNGGSPVSSYRVDWDVSSSFNSASDGGALGSTIVLADDREEILDVQSVTISSIPSVYITGTFTLSFDGQTTPDLPWDISASGLKEALEGLSTINTVDVTRDFSCSTEPGLHQCRDPQGLTWLITFSHPLYPGNQQSPYASSLTTVKSHRLQADASSLLTCSSASRVGCVHDTNVTLSLGTIKEQQSFVCSGSSSFTIIYEGFATTPFTPGGPLTGQGKDGTSLEEKLEALVSIGDVTLSCPACGTMVVNGVTVPQLSCTSAKTVYVTFNTELGDLPLLDIGGVKATQVQRGTSQTVVGQLPYHAVITGVTSSQPYFVRVAAYNEYGYGETVSTFPNTIYSTIRPPTVPQDVNVTIASASSLEVDWNAPLSAGGTPIDYYLIEWDTVGTFKSQCYNASSSCLASKMLPLGSVIVPESYVANAGTTTPDYTYTITELTPGIPYFVRVTAINTPYPTQSPADMHLHSPPAHFGYPNKPAGVAPMAHPDSIYHGSLVMDTATSLRVDYLSPLNVKAEGNNGAPITQYVIELAKGRKEVQVVSILSGQAITQGSLKLGLGADATTNCIAFNADASTWELELEGLDAVDGVSVSKSVSNNNYKYTITFDGLYVSTGDQSQLSIVTDSDCDTFLPRSVVLSTSTLVQGIQVPSSEVATIVTSALANDSISGYFDLSIDYQGGFDSIVATSGSPVYANVTKGSKVASVSASVTSVLNFGDEVVIDGERFTVDPLGSSSTRKLPLSSYHTTGVTAALIYKKTDTYIVGVTLNSATLTSSIDLTPLIGAGERIMIYIYYDDTSLEYVVSSVTSTTVVLTSSYKGTTNTAATLYRRKRVRLPYDASADEMKEALESLPGIGSVEVERFGPEGNGGYTWSVTFTSQYGPSSCPNAPCLISEAATVRYVTVSGCSNTTANGVYYQTSDVDGRPSYTLDGTPYYISYVPLTGSWTLAGSSAYVVATKSATASFLNPTSGAWTSGCTLSLPTGSQKQILGTTSQQVHASVVSYGKAPAFTSAGAVAYSKTVGVGQPEIQTITLDATANNIIGYFRVDFGNSGYPVTIKYDATADDVKQKLESISTLGTVAVTRSSTTWGYAWSITFVDNAGNLPLLQTSTASSPLTGSNVTLVVEELVAGSEEVLFDIPLNLTNGEVYAARVTPFNLMGLGDDSLKDQNIGRGVIPLQLVASVPPASPALSVSAYSSSQLLVELPEPASNGEKVTKYKLEWTTAANFTATPAIQSVQIVNTLQDTLGTFTLTYADHTTVPIAWDSSEIEVASALEALPNLGEVAVVRTAIANNLIPQYGYKWTVTFTDTIGQADVLIVDESAVRSESLTGTITALVSPVQTGIIPADYGQAIVYATPQCDSFSSGRHSPVQELRLMKTGAGTPTAGSYKLTLDGYSTSCIAYSATASQLRTALLALPNVDDVIVTETAAPSSYGFPYVYTIRFLGDYPSGEWPILRMDLASFGKRWPRLINPCTSWAGITSATWSIRSIYEELPCHSGSLEVQAITVEADGPIGGAFSVYYKGANVATISVDSTADEVQALLNAAATIENVQVTKVVHTDASVGYAWLVTFVDNTEPVEPLHVVDKFVTGTNSAVGVYPVVNITTTAQKPDISGQFTIRLGTESTSVLSYRATTKKVLEALNGLNSIGEVTMAGVSLGSQALALKDAESAFVADGSLSVYFALDLSDTVAIGDTIRFWNETRTYVIASVAFNSTPSAAVVASIRSLSSHIGSLASNGVTQVTLTTAYRKHYTLSANTALLPAYVGEVVPSKRPLDGRVSYSSDLYLWQAQPYGVLANVSWIVYFPTGSIAREQLAAGMQIVLAGSTYTIAGINVHHCGRDCVTLSAAYTGPSVWNGVPVVKAYRPTFQAYFTSNLTGIISVGDTVWVGPDQFTVTALNATKTATLTGVITQDAVGARPFVWDNGYEWTVAVKATTGDLSTIRAVPEANLLGTDLKLRTTRPKGTVSQTYIVGAASEVQTFALRAANRTSAVIAALQGGFTLRMGLYSTSQIAWGASAATVKTALETLSNIDRVTVERSGDGVSSQYFYGYVYTVTFWGEYGTEGIDQLTSTTVNWGGISIVHNTVRDRTVSAPFSSHYLALSENTTYALRASAYNKAGYGPVSDVVTVSTADLGIFPGTPTALALGAYYSLNSLSLAFEPPLHAGGMPITTYRIEWDSNTLFLDSSPDYGIDELSLVYEVQQLSTYFRSGDDVSVRGGTFTLSWGGHTTANLAYDISAEALEQAVSQLVGLQYVGITPVTVTRKTMARGFKWLITFKGLFGDVELLQADGALLSGDNPRIATKEVVKGLSDIYPGSYHYEVQTIRTTAASAISGYFKLSFEGWETAAIAVDESEASLISKLQALKTIFTVKVHRDVLDSTLNLYAWTVSFSHQKREKVQGAGNLGLITVSDISGLSPANSANVLVTERVAGTSPLLYDIEGLTAGVTYFCRVTAYNALGYGVPSNLASAKPLGQPSAPGTASVAIASGTSLDVTWSPATASNGAALLGYKLEWYSKDNIPEVQTITTSATSGISEVQRVRVGADQAGVNGFFTLSFNGQQTDLISVTAPAEGDDSVKEKLERLSTVGTVSVSRDYSRKVLQGVLVSALNNGKTITATKGSLSSLSVGDRIWVANEQLTVNATGTTSITVHPPFSGNGHAVSNLYLYKDAYGYQWDITFSSLIGDQPALVASPADNWAGTNPTLDVTTITQGLAALSGTFRVGYDGERTAPLPYDISEADLRQRLRALRTLGDVNITRTANHNGFNWRVTFVTQLGDVPMLDIDDSQLMGPNAKAVATEATRGQLPDDYQSISLQSPTADSYEISDLTMGTQYTIRVSAFNVEGPGDFVYATPAPLAPLDAPSAPTDVRLIPLSPTQLKVVWKAPAVTGGAPVLRYRVQWDIAPDFSNLATSGYTRDIVVNPEDGPVFCFNIPIRAQSSNIPRFARVLAYNNFKWSVPALSTPRSAAGVLRAPGHVIAPTLTVTSGVGLRVDWQEPSDSLCIYGGNGGGEITEYMIEWDTNRDMDSPAERYFFSLPADQLSFTIGGRNVTTGKMSELLEQGVEHWVRVTAINAVGVGIPTRTVPQSAIPFDQRPDSPTAITAEVDSATSLVAMWSTPLVDGGQTLKSYRIEWDTDPSFGTSQFEDVAVIKEAQNVVVETPVIGEVQSIQVTTAVTNERQLIRTRVTGVDEVQLITTTADEVVPEVQTVTTTAVDVDEVQELTLTATDIDEVQLVRTTAKNIDEIQRVTIATNRISEVQTIGFFLTNVDTRGCTAGSQCAGVEAGLSGVFTLKFDPTQCGGGSNQDRNFCQLGVDGTYNTSHVLSCTGASCISGSINPKTEALSGCTSAAGAGCSLSGTETTSMMYQLNGIEDANGFAFMKDGNSLGVQVKRYAFAVRVGTGATDGVYALYYEVTFAGDHLRGDVPLLRVYTSSVGYTGAVFATYSSDSPYFTTGREVGGIDAGTFAVEYIKGNQPDGTFNLDYTCESRTTPVSSLYATRYSTSVTSINTAGMEKNYWLRIGNGYYQIASINSGTSLTLSTAYSGSTGTVTGDADYGVFYSDPTATSGVSTYCYASHIRRTPTLDSSATTRQLSAALKATTVIDATSTSLTVTRTPIPARLSFVGYYWDITFHKQPGDLNPLTCIKNNLLAPTVTNGGLIYCNVTTIREGSMIDGYLELNTTYPHEYIGKPRSYATASMRWNVDPANMQAAMQAVHDVSGSDLAFGYVTVTRDVYIPSTELRWSGGYTWTITFLSKVGNVPAMTPISALHNHNNASQVRFQVSDQNSGVHDTYQGSLNYATFSQDDPGTAVDGNQVGGKFGLSFNGVYTMDTTFQVQDSITFLAMNASTFKSLIDLNLFGGVNTVDVTRSSTTNQAAGFTYTVVFRHASVGGNVDPIGKKTARLTGRTPTIDVVETIAGAEIRGSFQLRFNGYTTAPLVYNAEASDVQEQLNVLPSISPSKVVVTREGPMKMGPSLNGGVQVGGYIWYITFASSVWRDPTIDHDSTFAPGNWVGDATTYDDTWPSGHSKAWGKNVGDQPAISCIDVALYTTNGALPSYGCQVEEKVKGTDPLGGCFHLSLDTRHHPVINIQKNLTTGCIPHNALATRVDTNGDGTSMEEMLEVLDNIGDVSVTRSAANLGGNNGGYTWTVTFLRDDDVDGGQFGGCEQRDDFDKLCNAPGNVPKLKPVETVEFLGSCVDKIDPVYPYNCTRLHTFDHASGSSRPVGKAEVQVFTVYDPLYQSFTAYNRSHPGAATEGYRISYNGHNAAKCLTWDASATDVLTQVISATGFNPNNVAVERNLHYPSSLDTSLTFYGYSYTITYFDMGDVYDPFPLGLGLMFDHTGAVSSCFTATSSDYGVVYSVSGFSGSKNITAATILQGATHPTNCAASNCVDGVVLRSALTTFEVPGDSLGGTLAWNAPAQTGNHSVKYHLELATPRKVNVTRTVIGKYGSVEWLVRFVYNKNQVPPGTGDIPALTVVQGPDTAGNTLQPQVLEIQKGSTGLGGYFLVDYDSPTGPRMVDFDEPAQRLKRKLEEMSTIGQVDVRRYEYPSSSSGGWGKQPVTADGIYGGYQWVVRFLSNPGTYNGLTYPSGSGQLNPISLSWSSALTGTGVKAENVIVQEGSSPLTGQFTLKLDGANTLPLTFNQQPEEMEYILEELPTVGDVSVTGHIRTGQVVPGVRASVARDGSVATLSYVGTASDILTNLTYGDYIRIGGTAGTQSESVGGETNITSARVKAGSPVIETVTELANIVAPGREVRVGSSIYHVNKTGVEVQVLMLGVMSTADSNKTPYKLKFVHSGKSATTACIPLNASAALLKSTLEGLSNIEAGDLIVTRNGTGNLAIGDPVIYYIYFEGPSVRGNVAPLSIVTTGCTAPSGSWDKNVLTLIEGGRTAVQRVSMAVDSGYIDGAYFRLKSGANSTACIPYGASAQEVQDELNKLTPLSDFDTGLTVTATASSATITVNSPHYPYGRVFVGDRVRIAGITGVFTVKDIKGSSSIVLSDKVPSSATSAELYVVQDPTVVRRTGVGNSTTSRYRITLTADGPLRVLPGYGYYKLKVEVDGVAKVTPCLAYDALAYDIEVAINNLGFDFNRNGLVDDEDHVIVTRTGDGSNLWSYGYTYDFEFDGPRNYSSVSSILGTHVPQIEVVDEGSIGGCYDVQGNETLLLLTIDTTTAAHNRSTVFTVSSTTVGVLEPGDMIRIGGSLDPYKIYTIGQTEALGSYVQIGLTEPFVTTNPGSQQPIYLV